MKVTVVTSPANFDKIEVIKVADIYCPKDYVYFVPEGQDLLHIGSTIYQAEKEKNEWIRKYDNALQGLQYWKEKALEC